MESEAHLQPTYTNSTLQISILLINFTPHNLLYILNTNTQNILPLMTEANHLMSFHDVQRLV